MGAGQGQGFNIGTLREHSPFHSPFGMRWASYTRGKASHISGQAHQELGQLAGESTYLLSVSWAPCVCQAQGQVPGFGGWVRLYSPCPEERADLRGSQCRNNKSIVLWGACGRKWRRCVVWGPLWSLGGFCNLISKGSRASSGLCGLLFS